MRRRDIVLTLLRELGEIPLIVIESFFTKQHPRGRIARALMQKLMRAGLEPAAGLRRPSLSVLLSRLRRQGLVERSGPKRNARWVITPAGIHYLTHQKPRQQLRPDGIQRLVIFDIPEREKLKRDAIRRELVLAGYRQLQKSVWMGVVPLPEDFLKTIGVFGLRDCIHIFSIRESGTLKSG